MLIGELPLAELALAFLLLLLPAVTDTEPGGSQCGPGYCRDRASPVLAGLPAQRLHTRAGQSRLLALARDNERVGNIYIGPMAQRGAALLSSP